MSEGGALFDDSDESDDQDEAMPDTTQPTEGEGATTAETGGGGAARNNVSLFGDDEDDSEDDEDDDNVNVNGNADADANEGGDGEGGGGDKVDGDEQGQDTNNDDEDNDDDDAGDAEIQFGDGDIKGIKRSKPKTTTAISALPSVHMTVPSLPLPQFNKPVGEGNGVTLHMANLPKVVAIQQEAFHRNTYNSSIENEEFKGGTNSVVRWGNKTDHQTGESDKNNDDDDDDDDDDEAKTVNTILQCVSSLQSKFIARPASLESAVHKTFVSKKKKETGSTCTNPSIRNGY